MIPMCRRKLAQDVTERLYGGLQGYGSLLIEPGFWASALHLWATPCPPHGSTDDKNISGWRHVCTVPLADCHAAVTAGSAS
jgi:hypothetical protein